MVDYILQLKKILKGVIFAGFIVFSGMVTSLFYMYAKKHFPMFTKEYKWVFYTFAVGLVLVLIFIYTKFLEF